MGIIVAPSKYLNDFYRMSDGKYRNWGVKYPDGTIQELTSSFGIPLVEYHTAVEPRMAVSHDWTEDELRWIQEELFGKLNANVQAEISFVDELPADWVYPPPEAQ